VYQANPLAARAVGKLCEQYRVTFLLATPTFLQAYARVCAKDQLASLRYVVVGAEKLRSSLAESFRDKFGVEPLEGYGATELSPEATRSRPDVNEPGNQQIGHKSGSIGQPIPGVAARVVDPETFVDRPAGEEGLLLIRGANVMKGYLNDPVRTAEVMHDRWYVTGDIARFDRDGFISLTDRLPRFAKIAGEMVPLGAVEEAIMAALPPSDEPVEAGGGGAVGAGEQRCIVTAIPDAERGERLVVLHVEDLDP